MHVIRKSFLLFSILAVFAQSALAYQTTEDRFVAVIASSLGRYESEVQLDVTLSSLGADESDVDLLIIDLEDEFDLGLSNYEITPDYLVSDIVELIESLLQ